MNLYEILKENMVRFKTKNLIHEQQVINDTHPEHLLSYWEKQFIWFPGKLKPVKLVSDEGLTFKYRQIAQIYVSKAEADNLTGAWSEFTKTLKTDFPDVYKAMNGGPGSESMGIMVNKDYKQSAGFTITLIGPRKTKLDAAVVYAPNTYTWNRLTDRAWNTDSSSDDDSIPLDKSILFTDIYVSAPAKPGSEYELSSQLNKLARAAGIDVYKKVFKKAGGRVINRTNVADMNHPGVESQLQYAVVFINDPAYDEIRTTAYPDLDTHIYGKGVKTIDKSITEI